jgi:hypothetical protein
MLGGRIAHYWPEIMTERASFSFFILLGGWVGLVSELQKDYKRITRYIRSLRGGSQPILAEASDGLHYVVKFTNNLQGANLSFNESMGTELYRGCNLPVPSWKPLLITDDFLDQNSECRIQTPEGQLRPDAGLCFASRFLGGDGIRLLEILSGTDYKRVRNYENFWLAWLIDICAEHVDNRQAVFLDDGTGWLDAFFVDMGHLFGGPNGEQRRHFQASRYLDPRIYKSVTSAQIEKFLNVVQRLDVDRLWRQVHVLPDDWKTESALNSFAQCLNRLSTGNLLENILETIVDVQHGESGSEYSKRRRGYSSVPVLRLGIQATELEPVCAANWHGRTACA